MATKVNIKDVNGLETVLDTKLEAISKDMVEGVLTGEIDSHTHAPNHTHENKTILDDIEESLTSDLKTNYDTAYTHSQSTHAPTDAEANVQADWFEINDSYDSFIKNKPHILRYMGKLESSSDINLRLLEEGIYTLCMGTKYLFAPNLYCGTDEYSTKLSGHLTVCKPDGNGATMTYHDFHDNIVYVASAVNGVWDVLLWNDWKRLLTCKDETDVIIGEEGVYSYTIDRGDTEINVDPNFDPKSDIIEIDISPFKDAVPTYIGFNIIFSTPITGGVNVVIDNGTSKTINYTQFYQNPSAHTGAIFEIEYRIWNRPSDWLYHNRII